MASKTTPRELGRLQPEHLAQRHFEGAVLPHGAVHLTVRREHRSRHLAPDLQEALPRDPSHGPRASAGCLRYLPSVTHTFERNQRGPVAKVPMLSGPIPWTR